MPKGRNTIVRAALASTALLLLAGCQTAQLPFVPGPAPAIINADYQAGYVENLDQAPVMSLDQMMNSVPVGEAEAGDPEDKLRTPAVHDAALAYGAQGGLAWESRAINHMLQKKSGELTRVYDFSRVLIEAPGHAMILPPVISQSNENWETSDAGRTLRVADTYYEIIEQARFVPNAPLWQTYLLRSYEGPTAPNNLLLPRDRAEKANWKKWVQEGWEMGRKQANEIFRMDVARLERDLNGMVRYKQLLEEGKVDPPSVSNSTLGTTGSGNDMRVNDRAVTITKDPKLKVSESGEWRAPATTTGADGVSTGNDPAKSKPAQRIDASTSEVQAAAEASSHSAGDAGLRQAW